MKALGVWLTVLGVLRLSSVWFGFLDIATMRRGLFPQMTEIHGRTFGIWTFLNCTLLFVTASDLQNKPLYFTTLLSFFYVLAHFISECFIYKTMPPCGLVTPGFIAGMSIIWMLLEWTKEKKPNKSLKQS